MRADWKWPISFLPAAVIAVVATIVLAQAPKPLPDIIKIGALFDDDDNRAPLEAAFRLGVDMVNADRTILARSRLIVHIEKLGHGNSYKVSNKVCNMMEPGILTILGPMKSSATADHIQSMTGSFHIPHIETRWEYVFERPHFSINIHPHPKMLGKAYADLVANLRWKSLVLVYENEESLIRLQELLKMPKSFDDVKIVLMQLPPDSTDYRPLLKQIKRSAETRIVVDCSFDKIEEILRQASETEIISDYHNFLFTSLDLERINLHPYKSNNVNITGYRIVDTAKPQVHSYLKKWTHGHGQGRHHPLYSENVMMYDSVRLLAKAVDDLGSLGGLKIDPVNCKQGIPWKSGNDVVKKILEAEYEGLTGEIKFDPETGFRMDVTLDLLEKHRDNMIKTGTWTLASGVNYTKTTAQSEAQIVEKLQNKTLRITTTLTKPYVMAKKLDVPPEALERMSFEEKYEGFCIDMVKHLAEELKFKYKLQLVYDNNYGSLKSDGEWNGMIRELIDKKADVAVIDLSITTTRQKAVDFAMPYMTTGIGILYKKKSPPPPNLFSFLDPMSTDVWIYMTTAYLATSILMFLLARITPYEWESSHPCDQNPEELETLFDLKNSLWFGIGSFLCQGSDILPKMTPFEWEPQHPCSPVSVELANALTLHNCLWHNLGSVMQQGSDIAPKAISTRTVASIWWFFTLIMISSYTANLAAFLTAAKMDTPINSADDLAKQTKIKYGTYCCGSTNSFFKSSTIPTYQKMNAAMESAKPSVYTGGNTEGVERVKKEDGMYAFFMEAAAIEYNVERNCDLTQIGDLLDSKGYGIALPPSSPYTQAISTGILALQEKGILQALKNKWWKEMNDGEQCSDAGKNDSSQLGLANLGGVFIVLLGGMIMSCFIALAEFMWSSRRIIADPNQSIWSHFWKELKFAVDASAGNSKPVNTDGAKSSSSKRGSKSILDDPSHAYGIIEDKDKDSVYAQFNDNFSTKSKH